MRIWLLSIKRKMLRSLFSHRGEEAYHTTIDNIDKRLDIVIKDLLLCRCVVVARSESIYQFSASSQVTARGDTHGNLKTWLVSRGFVTVIAVVFVDELELGSEEEVEAA